VKRKNSLHSLDLPHQRALRSYRRFKKRNKLIHILFAAIAVVFFWRGIWGLLDMFFLPTNPLVSNLISVVVAFVILYFDDFHLKELE
jgi:hypothetical protein